MEVVRIGMREPVMITGQHGDTGRDFLDLYGRREKGIFVNIKCHLIMIKSGDDQWHSGAVLCSICIKGRQWNERDGMGWNVLT